MSSGPGAALAAMIASRRLQWARSQVPSSTSSVEVTISVGSPGEGIAQGENSEVLPSASVAVAVTKSPDPMPAPTGAEKMPSPATSVATSANPMNVSPSPLPDESHAAEAKNSTRTLDETGPSTVPSTAPLTAAAVMTGGI